MSKSHRSFKMASFFYTPMQFPPPSGTCEVSFSTHICNTSGPMATVKEEPLCSSGDGVDVKTLPECSPLGNMVNWGKKKIETSQRQESLMHQSACLGSLHQNELLKQGSMGEFPRRTSNHRLWLPGDCSQFGIKNKNE